MPLIDSLSGSDSILLLVFGVISEAQSVAPAAYVVHTRSDPMVCTPTVL